MSNEESTRATTAPEFTDRHGRLKDELRDLIEGMSVSIDVSTGEHDSGNRLFGVVNEVMDDDGDKCGVTLLVYETTPNFAAREPAPVARDLPNISTLKDIEYALKTPDDWDADYRSTWQKLQVADCNRREWQKYAMELRADLARVGVARDLNVGTLTDACGTWVDKFKAEHHRMPDYSVAFAAGAKWCAAWGSGDKANSAPSALEPCECTSAQRRNCAYCAGYGKPLAPSAGSAGTHTKESTK